MSLIPLGFWGQGDSILPQDGLVLHLDAGDTSSYPGSGTTWNNLANSNFTTTLVPFNTNNPIVYSGANGGSLLFSGPNQYERDQASVTSTLSQRQLWNSYWSTSTQMTCIAIVKLKLDPSPDGVAKRDGVIGQRYFFGIGFGFHIHFNFNFSRSTPAITMPYSENDNNFVLLGDPFDNPPSSGPSWENFNDAVIFLGFHHDGSTRSVRYWLNNNFYTTNTPQFTPANTYMTDETNNVEVIEFSDSGGWRDKNIFQIAIWNRALSDTEITAVYNSYRSRHGYTIRATNLIFYYDPSNPSSYSGSGTALNDLSGNSYTATLVNGVGFNSSDGNGSLTFDGSNDYIDLPSASADAFINQSFTIEFWLKPAVSKTHIFFTVTQDGVIQQRLAGQIISDGTINFAFYAQDLNSSANAISVGSWQHVAMRYRSSDDTSTIFLNGTQIAQGNQGPLLSSTGRKVRIGQWADDTGIEHWNGSMGDMYAYQAALTDSEILFNFNALKTKYNL
jgi:hypothetical protein